MIRSDENTSEWSNYKRLEDAAAQCEDTETALNTVHEIVSSSDEILWTPDSEYETVRKIYSKETSFEDAVSYYQEPIKQNLLANNIADSVAEKLSWQRAVDVVQEIYEHGDPDSIKPFSENDGLSQFQKHVNNLKEPQISSSPIKNYNLHSMLAAYLSSNAILNSSAEVKVPLSKLCVELATALYAIKDMKRTIRREEPFRDFIKLSNTLEQIAPDNTADEWIKNLVKTFLDGKDGNTEVTLSFTGDKITCEPSVFQAPDYQNLSRSIPVRGELG